MNGPERTPHKRIVDPVHKLYGGSTVVQVANKPEAKTNAELSVSEPNQITRIRSVHRHPQALQQCVGLGEFECSGADELAPTGVALLLRRCRKHERFAVQVERHLVV